MIENVLIVFTATHGIASPLASKPSSRQGCCLQVTLYSVVLDTRVYPHERQRVQDHDGILLSIFFGCHLTSIFDTRVKLEAGNPNMEGGGIEGTRIQNLKIAWEMDEEGFC